MTSTEAASHLDSRRAEIERALDAALPSPPSCPAALADAMRYSVMAGGKRLRPLLCVTACEAVGGHPHLALPAACALEFIHTYSLIHDDLPAMDNDTMRRGRPTLHVVAGDGMAILAGDALLTEAFALLARGLARTDASTMARAIRVIERIAQAAGAGGMVGGQAIDLASGTPGQAATADPAHSLDLAGLQAMHALKTGALIRASAVTGAIMGGADDERIARIDAAMCELGLAFQIVDDILDVEGASDTLGKSTGKDAAAGKPTYPALMGLAASREAAEACLSRAEAIFSEAQLHASALAAVGRSMVARTR